MGDTMERVVIRYSNDASTEQTPGCMWMDNSFSSQ
jgi:hypothetical protein